MFFGSAICFNCPRLAMLIPFWRGGYCARLVTDDFEIASLLSNRPRAQVQDTNTAASGEELAVSMSTLTCSKPFASHCFSKKTMIAHFSIDLK